MEGEPGVADPAVGERGVEELERAQVEHLLPGRFVEAVEQIAIHVVGAQSLQLTGQNRIHIGPGLYHPGRQLRGQQHPVAVTVGERLPHEGLARARSLERVAVVREGGVDVIDPVVDGVVQHPCSEGHIDVVTHAV